MKSLILADIHANLAALEAVLEREPDWDRVLFIGDAVDAGPRPDEVLSVLSDTPGVFLHGNHDRAILQATPEPPEPGSRSFTQWTSAQLSPANRRFLQSFEGSQRVQTTASRLRLHHGDFTLPRSDFDWEGRLWPDTDRSIFAAIADGYDAPTVVFGHSHVQFETRESGTHFVNPGSVGQHRLGQVKACYSVFDGDEFHLRACDYDAERTIEALEALPLDDEYLRARKRVYTEGVLPGDMRDFGPLREEGYR